MIILREVHNSSKDTHTHTYTYQSARAPAEGETKASREIESTHACTRSVNITTSASMKLTDEKHDVY